MPFSIFSVFRFVDNSVYLPNETSMSEAIATACLKRLLRDSFDSDETRDRMLVEDRLSRLLALVYERLNQSDSRNVTVSTAIVYFHIVIYISHFFHGHCEIVVTIHRLVFDLVVVIHQPVSKQSQAEL